MMENPCVTLATSWVGGLGKKELGILPALEILQFSELAASQHRAVQRCHVAAEGTEMGVNHDSAIPGVENVTHPRPVPVAAGAEDRHCPAGC